MNTFSLLGLFFLLSISKGNIWDNIFGNFNSPKLELPPNFSTILSYNNISDILIEISKPIGIAKMKIMNNNKTYILNMTENYLYIIKGSSNECTFQDLNSPYLKKDKESTFNANSFWNLISFYKGKDEEGFFKFEIGDLIRYKLFKSKIQISFDQEKNLHEVLIDDLENPILLQVKQKIIKTEFKNEYFRKDIDSNCIFDKNDDSQINDQIESEIKKFLPKISDSNNK